MSEINLVFPEAIRILVDRFGYVEVVAKNIIYSQEDYSLDSKRFRDGQMALTQALFNLETSRTRS